MTATTIRAGAIALFALAALAPAAHAATPPPPANVHDRAQVERYIRACEAEWAAQATTNDAASSRVCLADDYEGVSSRAQVVDKAGMLQPPPGPITVVSDTLDYIRIRFPTPDVAIAQGGETAVNKDGSRRSLIWTDTWLLRGGKWQIVTSQDSVLPKPYEARKK